MSVQTAELTVSYAAGCLNGLKKLPTKTQLRFYDMMAKVLSDPTRNGLNLERVEGARDKRTRSIRIDQAYRAIGFVSGGDLLIVHVDEHDKAYRWATNRQVKADTDGRRIRIVEVVEDTPHAPPSDAGPGLFDAWDDAQLVGLGVTPEEMPRVRALRDEDALSAAEEVLDPTTHKILLALAAGYAPEEVAALVGTEGGAAPDGAMDDEAFSAALRTAESRETIFIPESEAELRRVMEGDIARWRIFLHPEQRRLATRDFSGPVLVRGGAGTGKTVVAMHRARHLADRLAKDETKAGQRVLVVTFTTNLALDIETNLKSLCPEHFTRGSPRIEVTNLDRWVSAFLKSRGFDRTIVFGDTGRIAEIWDEVLARHPLRDLSTAFVRDEWEQVVAARGIAEKKDYLRASRTGRGTPLDRRSRTDLWTVFEAYRARMLDEGLAEPDEAHREALQILTRDPPRLPYASVVVDEAQDMGEMALRVLRAIVPPRPGGGDANSLFLVGDAHQRIYARKASLSACGIEVRGRSKRLRLNYRTTEEIRRWAVAVLEGVAVDDLDGETDTLAGYRSVVFGPRPELEGYSTRGDELAALVEWVGARMRDGEASVAVLARTNGLLGEVKAALEGGGHVVRRLERGRPDDPSKPGVRLSTMHRAKGLEFRDIAIVGVEEGLVPLPQALDAAVDEATREAVLERERSLLHVAATRAKRMLRISWTGVPSPVLPR